MYDIEHMYTSKDKDWTKQLFFLPYLI